MNKSRLSLIAILAFVVALLICTTVVVSAQGEQQIKAKDLPVAVTAAFQ